jgi:hypothetical protein
MIDPSDLLERWHADEEHLAAYGAREAAEALRRCRSDLSTWWRERQLDELTLEEAAAYSGLAYGTLSNKVRAHEIPNAGDKHRPRVRRCDLPMRAPGPPGHGETIDLADRILHARG